MSVIQRDKYFTSLPQHYYTSDAQFAEDVEKIWHRQWIYAGHVSQVKAPGDRFTFELLDESVIIVRDESGEIHALRNVCRHRGTRLCMGPGNSKRIVCPYHSWSYALNGTLVAASRQHGNDALNYDELGLFRAQVSVWQGLIFVSFSDEPLKDVSEMIDADSEREMTRVEPEKMKIACERVYDADANWKLLLENGVECYHCAGVHPEFCQTLDADAMAGYYRADYTPELVQGLVIPVQRDKETLSLDGHLVSRKLLGEFGRGTPVPNDFGAGFMTQPGYAWGDFHPDHAMIANCLPIDPTHSKFVVQWLVRQDAVEGVDYDVDKVIGLWDVTHRQDAAMLGRQQAGIKSTAYVPGPNSSHDEPGIESALNLYLEMIREGE